MSTQDDPKAKPGKPPKTRLQKIDIWVFRICVLLFVGLIAAHGGWLWYVTHQLDTLIAEIESRGEPMTIAALRAGMPAPQDNGWFELQQAIDIAQVDTPSEKATQDREFQPVYPLTPKERDVLLTYTRERSAALPLIEAGFAKPACVMDVPLVSPMVLQDVPGLNGVRSVANLLRYQALIDFEHNDHAIALRRLEWIELPAKGGFSYPTLVGYLVGSGCRSMAANAFIELAPDLKVAPAPGGATPKQLKRIIDSLLDTQRIDVDVTHGLKGERVDSLEMIRRLEQGKYGQEKKGVPDDQVHGWWIGRYPQKPFLRSNGLALVRVMSAYLDASTAATLPAMKQRIADGHPEVQTIQARSFNMLAGMVVPGIDRSISAKYQTITDRRLAATSLAIAWYRAEHAGAFPASLQDLVPTYLPAVPIDAMSAGQPIRYRAGDNPILWSVGDNGIDDNGDETITKNRTGGWSRPDRVVHLVTQPRENTLEPQINADERG